ncbi:hypothetical protein SDC9_189609 [bioreactor metagenome]|uniref:Uncharacterized protein n=1 Tax=bioreactor metagenome TaxID=1076179 RepID=A0A645I3J4_9ZZZZ
MSASASGSDCLRGESSLAAKRQFAVPAASAKQGAGRVFHPLYSAGSRRKPGRDFVYPSSGRLRDQLGHRQPANLSGGGRRDPRRKFPRAADGARVRLSRHCACGAGKYLRAAHGAAGQSLLKQRSARVLNAERRPEFRLYDCAVFGGGARLRKQDSRASRERRLHSLLRQSGGSCKHGHHRGA